MIGANNSNGISKFWDIKLILFPSPSIPYIPMPGLVWSKQKFAPNLIPEVFAKLNLIWGNNLENIFNFFNWL